MSGITTRNINPYILNIIGDFTFTYYKLLDWIPNDRIFWVIIAQNPLAIDLIYENFELIKNSINNDYEFSLFLESLCKNTNPKVVKILMKYFLNVEYIESLSLCPHDEILNFVDVHINEYFNQRTEYSIETLAFLLYYLCQNTNPRAISIFKPLYYNILNRDINPFDYYNINIITPLSLNPNNIAIIFLGELIKNNTFESSKLLFIVNGLSKNSNPYALILLNDILTNDMLVDSMLINDLFAHDLPLSNQLIINLLTNKTTDKTLFDKSLFIKIFVFLLQKTYLNIEDLILTNTILFFQSQWTYDILIHFNIFNEYKYLLVSSHDTNILQVIDNDFSLYQNNILFWKFLVKNSSDFAVDMMVRHFTEINQLANQDFQSIIDNLASNSNNDAINIINTLFNVNRIDLKSINFWVSIINNSNVKAQELINENIQEYSYFILEALEFCWNSPTIFEKDIKQLNNFRDVFYGRKYL